MAALIAGAFVADLVFGAVSPVFPLLAKHLGASTRELAALITIGGLASLSGVLPVARFADRVGKPSVFSGGILLLGLGSLDLAFARGFVLLALAQLMLGLGLISSFSVGLACLADAVGERGRIVAVGRYTAAMGAGFALGPLLAGWSVGALGFRTTFLAAGTCGAVGSLSVLLSLVLGRRGDGRHPAPSTAPPSRQTAPSMGRRIAGSPGRAAVVASIANLPVSLAINVGILTFFPVYVASLGWSPALTGAVLFGRASASTISRLAVRHVDRLPVKHLTLIKAALLVETGVLALVSINRSVAVLVCLLVVEGVNYGVTVTLAQLTIVAGSSPGRSAASLVLFNASSSVAQIVGGALVFLLVGRHSSRTALLIVVASCLLLSLAFFAAELRGRRALHRALRPATSSPCE